MLEIWGDAGDSFTKWLWNCDNVFVTVQPLCVWLGWRFWNFEKWGSYPIWGVVFEMGCLNSCANYGVCKIFDNWTLLIWISPYFYRQPRSVEQFFRKKLLHVMQVTYCARYPNFDDTWLFLVVLYIFFTDNNVDDF